MSEYYLVGFFLNQPGAFYCQGLHKLQDAFENQVDKYMGSPSLRKVLSSKFFRLKAFGVYWIKKLLFKVNKKLGQNFVK